jgi:hypothetical protein
MGAVVGSSLSISRAWDETIEIFRRDGGLLVSVALALIVLPSIVVTLIAPVGTEPSGAGSGMVQLLKLVDALIGLVGQLAVIRLTLGPPTTVGSAIGHAARRFPSTLGAAILIVVGVALVAVPVVFLLGALMGVDVTNIGSKPTGAAVALVLIVSLAFLAVSVRFTLLSPVASAEEIGPIGIIRRSWALTKGHYWRMLGLVALLLVAAIFLMAAAGVIGGLLAGLVSREIEPFSLSALILAIVTAAAQGAFSVMAAMMLARVYAQLAGRDIEASVPISGT